MWKRTIFIATALPLCATLSFADDPQTLFVQGQHNIGVDRENVQAALDLAQPGDTVELVGDFQFDGVEVFITKSRLTLTGIVVDNDGDGEVNEDWTDGVDNDGDGSIDEDDWDAVIHGLDEDHDGFPDVDNVPPYTLFNRAVGIKGGSGDLRGIAVRHLKFYTVLRGVEVIGGHTSDSHLCEDFVNTGDEIDGVVVEKNLFDNTRRGAQIIGTVAEATLRDNLAIGSLNQALLVFGDGVACVEDLDPDFTGVFPTDRPQRIEISGNRVMADPSTGISIYGTDHSTVRDNAVETAGTGVYMGENLSPSALNNLVWGANVGLVVEAGNKATVMHNAVAGGFAGIYGLGDSPGTRITNNTVVESLNGVYLVEATTEFTLANNEFWSSWFVDVNLRPLSHHNTVIATDFETTVLDQGFDNRLIGTLAMIHNPGIPDDVRYLLEEIRAMIATKQPR